MKKEARGGGAATHIRDSYKPSKCLLSHFEGFWIRDQEKHKRAIKGIFGLEGKVDLWRGGTSHSEVFEGSFYAVCAGATGAGCLIISDRGQ